jgi:ribose 5-phosphate isomerase A
MAEVGIVQNRIELDRFKKSAAESAVTQLRDGMVVGLGSGSTAALVVQKIGERVQRGLRIVGIPTSEQTGRLARDLGIPLSTLDEHSRVDVTIDGADEVELGTLNLIKGRGGALLREKIVASASNRLLIVVDETKLVNHLAILDAIPVEVIPFGWQTVARRIKRLGTNPILRRRADNGVFITDSGNYILDCSFGEIPSVTVLGEELDRLVGVVEHGLFLGMVSEVIVGGPNGARVLLRAELQQL